MDAQQIQTQLSEAAATLLTPDNIIAVTSVLKKLGFYEQTDEKNLFVFIFNELLQRQEEIEQDLIKNAVLSELKAQNLSLSEIITQIEQTGVIPDEYIS